MVKTSVIRLAFAMARELRRKNVAAIALTPGFLRSEVMLDRFGVTEANWRDAVKKTPDYAVSETPLYAGRAVAALAADPDVMKKSGRVFSAWGLSDEYAFVASDGNRPHWGKHFEAKYGKTLKPCDEEFYAYWKGPDRYDVRGLAVRGATPGGCVTLIKTEIEALDRAGAAGGFVNVE
jgi:hypothetical protein